MGLPRPLAAPAPAPPRIPVRPAPRRAGDRRRSRGTGTGLGPVFLVSRPQHLSRGRWLPRLPVADLLGGGALLAAAALWGLAFHLLAG
jgi:hypothetical protein